MTEVTQEQAKLEDLMAAMDVVDTLRHQEQIVDRELDTAGRRTRLMQRLRDLYSAQGIDVPDHVLEEGIQALEQERFKYKPVPNSLSKKLALWYVNRRRWSKPLGFVAVAGTMYGSVHYFGDVLPEQRKQAALPKKIELMVKEIGIIAKDPKQLEYAQQQSAAAAVAMEAERFSEAEEVQQQLQSTLEQLRAVYSIKVVSRPGEFSGIWRVPSSNESARNYYLVVEAINEQNESLRLPILSEETGKSGLVSKWGLRVDKNTFDRIADDKADDGIIQNNVVGRKQAGYLSPEYTISTNGAAITQW